MFSWKEKVNSGNKLCLTLYLEKKKKIILVITLNNIDYNNSKIIFARWPL